MSTATKDILSGLHGLVAQSLIDKLKSGDAKPADLAVAVKFLKDNGIDSNLNDPKMKELQKQTANVLNFPFNPETAAASA